MWFGRRYDHDGGFYEKNNFWRLRLKKEKILWNPPPAAADAAIEELRKARLKRQKSHHIVSIPKLFTHFWLKQLNKACDVVFEITPTFNFWNKNMFEPLVIGICFPFIPHRPWQLKGKPLK